jgi:hypothetical protein
MIKGQLLLHRNSFHKGRVIFISSDLIAPNFKIILVCGKKIFKNMIAAVAPLTKFP